MKFLLKLQIVVGIIMKMLCFLLVAFSSFAFANSPDESWLKIMHYELSDNSYDNRVTNMDFFFNSDEKKDPIKEFEAQKKFFSKSTFDPKDMETVCRFPMRATYFSKLLKRKFQQISVKNS